MFPGEPVPHVHYKLIRLFLFQNVVTYAHQTCIKPTNIHTTNKLCMKDGPGFAGKLAYSIRIQLSYTSYYTFLTFFNYLDLCMYVRIINKKF